MPYIAVKGFPKDAETKQKIAEGINQVILEHWGCTPDAVSISIEDIEPDAWEETVVKQAIEPNADKMLIHNGKRMYKINE